MICRFALENILAARHVYLSELAFGDVLAQVLSYWRTASRPLVAVAGPIQQTLWSKCS